MKVQSGPAVAVGSGLRVVMLGAVYAAASGVLLALALPPYDVPLLGFVAFAPLLVAAFRAPRYASLLYALVAANCTAWVVMALPLSVRNAVDWFALVPFAVFGAFLSLILVIARRLGQERGWATILGVGSVGVLSEWTAAQVDFPYTVALTLWRDTPLLWLAGWLGVWGLAFLVWSVNTAVAVAWLQRRFTTALKIFAGALLGLHALGWLQMSLPRERETLRVAVVQSHSTEFYPALIRQAKTQGAQLIVLPEVCCDPTKAGWWAKAYQVSLIFGHWTARNSASLALPDGTLSEPYYKIHPYGGEPPSWIPGDPIRAFNSPFGTLGAVICYDTMFAAPCRQQASNGARLIAVPTNDPIAPNLAFHHLHAATTTLRAAEHRVPLARSEYNAASMIVDEWGRVLAYASEGEQLAVADVPLGSGAGTLASRVGDWYVLGYLVLLVGALRSAASRESPRTGGE
ncbi:MAG: carbon-nitrogen hydrolase family protein [Fimbriimonadales bacterium]|nr:carbon-nitrogen hydrolase family protein [Fimbriimonadales bacterium]